MSTLGNMLYMLRDNAGLSRTEVACVLSVSVESLRLWETDKVTPSLSTLVQLANVYHTKVSSIMSIYDDVPEVQYSDELSKLNVWYNKIKDEAYEKMNQLRDFNAVYNHCDCVVKTNCHRMIPEMDWLPKSNKLDVTINSMDIAIELDVFGQLSAFVINHMVRDIDVYKDGSVWVTLDVPTVRNHGYRVRTDVMLSKADMLELCDTVSDYDDSSCVFARDFEIVDESIVGRMSVCKLQDCESISIRFYNDKSIKEIL